MSGAHRRTPGLAAALLAALPSCISIQDNRELDRLRIIPGLSSKEDVIRVLGAPSGIRVQGKDRVYSFSHSQTSGTSYGVGNLAIAFALEATHVSPDVLEVVVGPDRVVREVRRVEVPQEAPLFPFDESGPD